MNQDSNELTLESREALQAAALLGETFSLPILFESGVDAKALDKLFDQGILIPEGASQARFYREEVRISELRNMPWSQKRRLGSELAKIVERHRGDAALIGSLHLAAQDFVAARGRFVQAAEQLCAKSEYGEALKLLRQALELWPPEEEPDSRIRVLKEMARCASNIGDHETANIAWKELVETAEESSRLRLHFEA